MKRVYLAYLLYATIAVLAVGLALATIQRDGITRSLGPVQPTPTAVVRWREYLVCERDLLTLEKICTTVRVRRP